MAMNIKKYKQARALVILFIVAIVAISIVLGIYLLAVVGIFTGMLFLSIVRSQTKVTIDEREQLLREKTANITYAIFTPTIGIGAFFLLLPSYSRLAVFSRGEFLFIESLGMIFAYLTLLLIGVYTITYFFLNRKFGGGDEE